MPSYGHTPEPGIIIGPYRILPVIGVGFALYDERIKDPVKTAWIGKTIEAAKVEANRLVALGSPVVIAGGAKAARRVELVRDEDDQPTRRRG